jgi:hypothetical protein
MEMPQHLPQQGKKGILAGPRPFDLSAAATYFTVTESESDPGGKR